MSTASTTSTHDQLRPARWLVPGVAILLALAALIVALYGVTRPRHELVLSDPSGRERIRLSASNEGGVIQLLDAQGRARAAIRQEGERVTFDLLPAGGDQHAIRLLATEKGEPVLDMLDPGTRSSVKLGALGGGGLTLNGPAGGVSLGSTSISTIVLLQFGSRTGKLEISDGRAILTFDDGSASPVTLVQTPRGSSLELAGPKQSGAAVELNANQSGGRVTVNGKTLSEPDR